VDDDLEGGISRRIAYRDEPANGRDATSSGRVEEGADGAAETTSLLDGSKKWREPAEHGNE
jgi:hypothetical protein